ncbi:hypothetical protein OROGR_010646 [Orobanche gracilis]
MEETAQSDGPFQEIPKENDAGASFVLQSKGEWWHAGFHLTTAIVGPTILTLPYAFRGLGWVLGFVCLTAMGMVTFYSYYLMSLVLDHCEKDGRRHIRFRELAADVLDEEVQDARMLAGLLEEQIDSIGRDIVVQGVTDNDANFKAAGGLLCQRICTLYWTPCAAHCLDLMLEDITKLKEFDATITQGRGITTFIYRYGRLLYAMREKTMGRDIVKTGATRFATAFLTLQSLYKNKDALRKLFGGEEWFNSNLAKTVAGGKVHDVVLSTISTRFWNNVEDCIRASQPLLVVLRIVDGDEKPAMTEICTSMEYAKAKIKSALEKKPRLSSKVLSIIEKRWESQMEVDLYSATLFLNPGRFFDIKEDDYAYSSRLRMKFNDVLERMVLDTSVVEKISGQADQYENSRILSGSNYQYVKGKLRIHLIGGVLLVVIPLSLQCLQRESLDFVVLHPVVNYNRKIATRFQKRREDGKTYSRHRASGSSHIDASSDIEMEPDPIILNDDEDVDDDYGHKPPTTSTHETSDRDTYDLELDEYV